MKGRDPLTWAAVVLGVVAFVGSFEHVSKTVAHHGQRGWLAVVIALMPELSVVLAVLKLRRDGVGQLWPWLAGGSAVAFTVAANLAQAEASLWGVVVAGWPAWSAVSAAALIEFRPADEQRVSARVSADPARVADRVEEEPRTSAPPVATAGITTPSSAVSRPPAAPASRSSSAGASGARTAGTSGRSGGRPAPADLQEAFEEVVADLTRANRTVNYKNVAPGLRDRGHTAGRAKVDGLIAEHAKPKLHAVL